MGFRRAGTSLERPLATFMMAETASLTPSSHPSAEAPPPRPIKKAGSSG